MRKRHRSDTDAGMMAAKVKRIFPSFEASLRTNTARRQRGLIAHGGLLFVHDIRENTHAWKLAYELKLRDRKPRHTIQKG